MGNVGAHSKKAADPGLPPTCPSWPQRVSTCFYTPLLAGYKVLGDLCTGRGSLDFKAPNTENVTYEFDYSVSSGQIKFWKDVSSPLSLLGFQLESQAKERTVPKWRTVKEYSPNAALLRVNVSGRFLVRCPDEPQLSKSLGRSRCAFKVCTRGRPVFESLKTRTFTHTAHVVTSGVFFALYMASSPEGLFLNPRLMLVLECGDEVPLVEDRLGPLQAPHSFYADFAVLDDGGRNLQMDLIFRGLPGEGEKGSGGGEPNDRGPRTLRTCLQEYTTFNSQVQPACIALGSSDLAALVPSSTVHLQNLVLSEEPLPGAAPAPATPGRPLGWRTGAATFPAAAEGMPSARGGAAPRGGGGGAAAAAPTGEAGPPAESPIAAAPPPRVPAPSALEGGTVLFGCSNTCPEAAGPSPQSCPSEEANPTKVPAEAQTEQPTGAGATSPSKGSSSPSAVTAAVKDFWYHVRYGAEADEERPRERGMPEDEHMARLRGEFWLSKEAVDKKALYLHCSCTLAQALTMCIIFRFSCPTDFLSLIENQVASVLSNLHIPTNGVVLGVEPDPRHRGLYRMFVEHRNEIMDDMVICESRVADLSRTIAHQEVYDSGSHISYRVTLCFPDGSWQQAVLQVDAARFEGATLNEKGGNPYPLVEEPSTRFPILPCLSRQLLSPANRVFVYSATAWEPPPEAPPGILEEDSFGTPTIPNHVPHDWSTVSEGTAEDWQSAGGGQSDGEGEPAAKAHKPGSARAGADPEQAAAEWQRPLVESVLLAAQVEEPPFKCVPTCMSS